MRAPEPKLGGAFILSTDLDKSLPPQEAFYKFTVGEGSPLPKKHEILCPIHGRRDASPTMNFIVPPRAVWRIICAKGNDHTPSNPIKKELPQAFIPSRNGSLGKFLERGRVWEGEDFFSERSSPSPKVFPSQGLSPYRLIQNVIFARPPSEVSR